MTVLYSWQTIRVSPVGFAPYLSLRAWVIYFHILSFHLFFSCPLPLWLALSVTFVKESVYVCAMPGSCWVCVLSLSLMSTHNSHCSYLKWPEPHQQIKESSPACHAAPSLGWVVYTLSGGERLLTETHYSQTYMSYRGKTSHKNLSFKLGENILKHSHLSSLVIFF